MIQVYLYWALFSLVTMLGIIQCDRKQGVLHLYKGYDIFLLFFLSIFFPGGIAYIISGFFNRLWKFLIKEVSLDKFKYYIIPIINPSYWNRIGMYDKEWDRELNNFMDWYTFKYVDEHTAILGVKEIWIANHPYASFYNYRLKRNIRDSDTKRLPSRKTVAKARDKYLKDIGEK